MYRVACSLLLFVSFQLAAADRTVVTTEGEEIILREDGTYEIGKVDPPEKETDDVAGSGFRGVPWGASVAQVKEHEEWELKKESEGSLFFNGTLLTREVNAVYLFTDGILTRACYLFVHPRMNKTLYVQDFSEVIDVLTRKYGEPEKDDWFWFNDRYRDKPSEYGMAIQLGHLARHAEWQLEDTMIQAMLSGENFEVTFVVFYDSLEHLDQVEAETVAQEEEGF